VQHAAPGRLPLLTELAMMGGKKTDEQLISVRVDGRI
jgi:hypothetical protein